MFLKFYFLKLFVFKILFLFNLVPSLGVVHFILRAYLLCVYARRKKWTSGSPHFLDNRLTNGGEDVSLMRRSLFTSRKIPGTHLC
jgi:hypothetical protein